MTTSTRNWISDLCAAVRAAAASGTSASPAAAAAPAAIVLASSPAPTAGGTPPPLPPASPPPGGGGSRCSSPAPSDVWGKWFRENFYILFVFAFIFFSVTAAALYNSSDARHEESLRHLENDRIKKCGKAAEDGGVMPQGCGGQQLPPKTNSLQATGVITNCPALQVGRFTVYDGTARRGCTAEVRGSQQLRLKGRFRVTQMKDGNVVSFVNLNCDNYEYAGSQPVLTTQGGYNSHTCVGIGKPTDMPESMTVTITSI